MPLALFGRLLLAGVLTQPGDEQVSAVAALASVEASSFESDVIDVAGRGLVSTDDAVWAIGPGATVQGVGIDVPGGQPLELCLTTTAGPVVLGSTTVEEGGYFR